MLIRFLYYTISTRIFTPSLLPPLLLHTRAILFPNNTLGPAPPPPPTQDEARLIRRKAASDILSLIPAGVARTFFAVKEPSIKVDGQDATANEEVLSEMEDRVMGWTDDAEMNKYLIYAILEHFIVRLVPELTVKTASELLADRGVNLAEDEDSSFDGRENGIGTEKNGFLDG